MDRDELIRVRAEYDARMRRGARADSAGARVERVGAVVRQTAAADGWNCVLWSDLDGTDADAEIAAQVAHYRERGVGEFEWKLYDHDRPADLGERLRAAGFVAEPPETLMVGRTADLAGLSVEPPEGITLRAVTDEAGGGGGGGGVGGGGVGGRGARRARAAEQPARRGRRLSPAR
ncbi:hypothetical protein ACFXPJ_24185, partial [Streptomyces goshikiensis]